MNECFTRERWGGAVDYRTHSYVLGVRPKSRIRVMFSEDPTPPDDE